MYGVRARHYDLQDLLISCNIVSWVSLGANEHGSHGTALEHRTCAFEACNGDLLVSRFCESIRVDHGVNAGIVRSYGDIATRERRCTRMCNS